MSPLQELSVDAPRPVPLARRYARKLDPWWGFVVAGVVWFVVVLVLTILAAIEVGEALGYADASTGAQVLTVIALVAGLTIGIAGFTWWRRRRLATKARLVRDGDLIEVEVTGRPFRLTGWKTRTTVDLAGHDRTLRCVFNRWFLPTPGDTITVLHHRSTHHIVAFDRAGAMFSGHVADGQLN